MRRVFLFVLAAVLSVGSFAQNNHTVDEVVWVVGDEAILRSDVERVRNEYGSQVKGNPYCVIPEQLAIQKLFLHQAEIDSVEVSDADVSKYVEMDLNQKVLMAGSKEKLEEYMNMTYAQIKDELFEQYKNRLISEKVQSSLTKDNKVTPAEVRSFFSKLPEDSLPYIPTQVEVQVLVQRPVIRQEEIERVKEQLRGWAERIQNGTTSFSALARMFSADEGSAREGGELDYAGKTDFDPNFAVVAFSLTDPKKVSKVVQSEYGYHIIQLIDRKGDKVKVRHILRRPEVEQRDIDSCMMRMDSIAADIKAGKFTFEVAAHDLSDDKDTRNNHGIMMNRNQETGNVSTRFEMGDLPGEIARQVSKMKVGDISEPFTMVDKRGMEVCAIVKLKNRIPAHRASVTEDFQILKGAVEQKKNAEFIRNWVAEKLKNTYVRINPEWRNCEFQYKGWVR